MRVAKYIITILLIIISFELFLRYSPFGSGISPVIYDKHIGMWHKSNYTNYITKECYKNYYYFDAKGRIQNNYHYDNKKKDIVIIGDSQIEALMVKNEYILHNSLYHHLNGQFNVLNFGLSGTGAVQQWQILQHKVNLHNTNTLIHFIFVDNDFNDANPDNFDRFNRPKIFANFHTLQDYAIIPPKSYDITEQSRDILANFEWYTYLKKNLFFYQNLYQRLFNVIMTLTDENTLSTPPINVTKSNEQQWQNFTGAIYQIDQLAKEHNFAYKVILQHGSAKNMQILTQFLTKYKIEHIDVTSFLQLLATKQPLSFSCDPHWKESTHQALAKYIGEQLF